MKYKLNHLLVVAFIALFFSTAAVSRAADPVVDEFAAKLDLTPLRLVAVQHNQTMKTLDTFARQVVTYITGHPTLDDRDPVFTLLDLSYRPHVYLKRNIIKIENVPLRKEFENLDSIDAAEKQRIVHDGTISLVFLAQKDVQDLLEKVQSNYPNKTRAIDQIMNAGFAMQTLCVHDADFIPAAIIPPGTKSSDGLWRHPLDLVRSDPDLETAMELDGRQGPALPAGYENEFDLARQILTASTALQQDWLKLDPNGVNQGAKNLADLLPKINPAVYPSMAKRQTEVIYNRLMKLTIPGAALYFIAFVLFLVAAQSEFAGTRLWALRLMVAALLVHTIGIGIRWWLVGDVFPPIKNEFESVMFSAWFGALIGLILELRKSRGLFGAAASFVGMLSLVAIFAAPYVTGKEIGGEIAPVQGILMSYWLYIHVTMVTASYALIGMGFALSVWWLVRYYMNFGTFRRVPGNLLSSDAAGNLPGGSGSSLSTSARPAGRKAPAQEDMAVPAGGAAALGFAQTVAGMFFLPYAQNVPVTKTVSAQSDVESRMFLARLDQANLVVLQLAFWVLGTGIILGAIWADQSWGRPWGWDPKETFALVTWIVYLIVVHVRVVTVDKAWWTAVLSCLGFFVMLFNWIGVNFMLVGLHSYA